MLRFFNPGHETAVWNESPYYMPPQIQVKMQADLSFLPAWYGNPDDLIFVEEKPENSFFDNIRTLQLPTPICLNDLPSLQQQLTNEVVDLWGISPAAIHLFHTFNSQYKLNLIIPTWNQEYRSLCSRLQARDCLQWIISQIPEINPNIIPQCHSYLNSIEQQLIKQPEHYLAKAIYSSSGQGLLWLPKGKLSQSAKQIIQGRLKKQGVITLEKVLDKSLDFAMEFTISKDKNVTFVGYSLFQTTNKGQYACNILLPQEQIENKIHKLINPDLLECTKLHLQAYLQTQISPFYQGIIGVDMMAYQENGTTLLHPCLEINMRHNMGTLSIALQKKHLVDTSSGYFFIDYSSQKGELANKDKELKQQYPLTIEEGKIKAGYLSLCPVNDNSQYRAYMIIYSSYPQQ